MPVRDFRSAKSRLGDARVPPDRLARAFLEDVLDALRQAQGITDIIVATHDPAVEDVVAKIGAMTIDDQSHPGINAAAAHAATFRAPGTGIAVLVSDLPCLTGEAVDIALGVAEPHATSFVPDLEGSGTSMWMSPLGAGLPSHFGVQSRAAHSAAGALDLVIAHPEMTDSLLPARLDVDTEAALDRAVAHGVGPRTAAALAR